MYRQPLAEVFGFPIEHMSPEAERYRISKLCPFNNKVPNCTKDRAQDPLGVCSIFDGESIAVTCPVRFRQNWLIAEDAARFFFPPNAKWTSLAEVRLDDGDGKSAGNIDFVLVSYDDRGKILDYGSLEIQSVYISGNVRRPFEDFIADPETYRRNGYVGRSYPRADYLSSSRKRLAPQIIYKGGIFCAWKRKMAVALHKAFFDTLPTLKHVDQSEAEIAWFLYDLVLDANTNRFNLVRCGVVYTLFEEALSQITEPNVGSQELFLAHLQEKLDDKLESAPPDTPTLGDILGGS